MPETILLSIIALLLSAIVYFIKKIFDKTEKIDQDISKIKPKVEILWEINFAKGHSPLTLNEKGEEILNQSGIKELVDDSLLELTKNIESKKPVNAYQVQETAKEIISNLKNDQNILLKLQTGAFDTGVDVDSVLFVGSIYLRDLVLPKFNCKLEDVDTQKNI